MVISIYTIDYKAYKEVEQAFNQNELEYIIFITSDGGNVNITKKILYLINKYKEKTTLIAVGYIYSAAFSLFFSALCKKELLGQVLGMYHITRMKSTYSKAGILDMEPIEIDTVLCTDESESLLRLLKVPNKIINAFLNGSDLYFSPTEMQNFLEIVNKQ